MTQQEKANFFAQYLGQEIMSYPHNSGCLMYVGGINMTNLSDEYIILTPLSMITDEDAIEVATQQGFHNKHVTISKENQIQYGKEIAETLNEERDNVELYYSTMVMNADYLRSKGYALPWNGHTVEEMEKSGWLKLNKP